MVHPSQTLLTQWPFHPPFLSGDGHVTAVANELVYSGYPDCIFALFTGDLQESMGGKLIYYDFPVLVHQPLRLRVFGRSGPSFAHLNVPFAYRLRVQVYSASDVLLQQWDLDEGIHFPHYKPANPMPSDPNLIPMVTLYPNQPWKRLRLTALIINWPGGSPVMPPGLYVGDDRWSELSVSYIEAGPAEGQRMLRIRPMTGASV